MKFGRVEVRVDVPAEDVEHEERGGLSERLLLTAKLPFGLFDPLAFAGA